MFDVLSKLSWFFKQYWKQYTVAIVLLMIARSYSSLFTWEHN